jgi:Leucine-rich repeat (LRR) protein
MDSLDVSANIALTILKCNNNGLLSINTTGLTGLTYLDCSNNGRLNFSSSPGEAPGYYVISTPIFDFASNVALAYLNCSSNGLSSLDVSENAALTYLDCSNYSSTNGEGDFIGGGTLSSLDF